MNNKKFIWIAVVVVVIIGIVFLLSRDETNEATLLDTTVSSNMPALDGHSVPEMIVSDNVQTESADDNGASTEEVSNLEEESTTPKIVTYTDSGFSPKTITIELGDTVTFINESSKSMWVASAVHPTHTLYPEKSDSDCLGSTFDSCERISVGESWSFAFNQEGSWKYHNHVSAGKTGTVEVQ